MAETITLQVARYRPESESEPAFQEYQVPCQRDWVVLDALNYIKDTIDGTLSYRWSCRMGICGSCGMMVNGEPKLTCAAFLNDYAPGPIRVEPLANFPVCATWSSRCRDFMHKLPGSSPGSSRQGEAALRGRIPADARAAGGVQAIQHVHQLHALLLGLPGLRPGSKFLGPAAIALAQRYNLDSRDEGAKDAAEVLSEHDGHLGLHLRRRVHPGLSQDTSIPPARSSATSWPRRWMD